MKRTTQAWLLAHLLLGWTLLQGAALAAGPAPLPGDSVLQVAGVFTDQSNRHFQLADRRGSPQLVSMFYASCQYVCPLLIETGSAVTGALSPAERSRLNVLLVTLDPARDTPKVLARVAQEHHVQSAQWTLARADAGVVRQLAAALDVRYRKLASGDFNHTTVWVLLDAEGRMLARTEDLNTIPDAGFLAAVRAALR